MYSFNSSQDCLVEDEISEKCIDYAVDRADYLYEVAVSIGMESANWFENADYAYESCVGELENPDGPCNDPENPCNGTMLP